MPIYKYVCDNCGFDQEQFLRIDKDSVTTKCKRCLKQTIASQVVDNAVEIVEKDDVPGVLRHEEAGA